jgi:hypothetical protein
MTQEENQELNRLLTENKRLLANLKRETKEHMALRLALKKLNQRFKL